MVHLHADLQLRLVAQLLLVSQRQEADLVQRICCIGDQLAQEDFL